MTKVQKLSTQRHSQLTQRHFIKELSRCLEVIDLCDDNIGIGKHVEYYKSFRQEAVEKYADAMVELMKEVITNAKTSIV